MLNLWKSLAVTALCYAVGHYFGGSWVTGIVPALFGFMIAYFILARRSMNKFTAITQEAMQQVQEGQEKQDPSLMMDGLEKALKKFSCFGHLQRAVSHCRNGTCTDGCTHISRASLQLQLKMREDMQRNRAAGQRLKKKGRPILLRVQVPSRTGTQQRLDHDLDSSVARCRHACGDGVSRRKEVRSDRAPDKVKKCWFVRPIVLADVRLDAP